MSTHMAQVLDLLERNREQFVLPPERVEALEQWRAAEFRHSKDLLQLLNNPQVILPIRFLTAALLLLPDVSLIQEAKIFDWRTGTQRFVNYVYIGDFHLSDSAPVELKQFVVELLCEAIPCWNEIRFGDRRSSLSGYQKAFVATMESVDETLCQRLLTAFLPYMLIDVDWQGRVKQCFYAEYFVDIMCSSSIPSTVKEIASRYFQAQVLESLARKDNRLFEGYIWSAKQIAQKGTLSMEATCSIVNSILQFVLQHWNVTNFWGNGRIDTESLLSYIPDKYRSDVAVSSDLLDTIARLMVLTGPLPNDKPGSSLFSYLEPFALDSELFGRVVAYRDKLWAIARKKREEQSKRDAEADSLFDALTD